MHLSAKMITLLEIGQQIRKERKKQKMTGVELAELCDIHRSTLGKLESGTGNVELNTLLAICAVLKMSIRIVPQEVEHIPSIQTPKTKSVLEQFLEEKNLIFADGKFASGHEGNQENITGRPRLALGKNKANNQK